MPYYDYKCAKCETKVELFHSINDERPKCAECGGDLKNSFKTAPPNIASGIRIQNGIDQIRTNTHNKYMK